MTSPEVPALLVERFDALLFDLDGVVYVGPTAVPFAADTIAVVRERGVSCVYVTNNAARPPQMVADHLSELGIAAEVTDVVTSPQAAVSLLTAYVPAGARVLVIGGLGIEQALSDRGFVPVRSLDDGPAAVMQGYSPDLSWRDLAEATFAVRQGLPWISTNPDVTFPTPRGVAPGNGSLVDVVARTVGHGPDAVAGKPEPALLHEAIGRVGARRPLMIGDRLDTDIAAGTRVSVPTLLVFTGVTTMLELLTAAPPERPDYVTYDLRGLLEPYPDLVHGDVTTCGVAAAQVRDGVLTVDWPAGSDPWAAVRAAAAMAWRCADAGQHLDVGLAAGALTEAALPAGAPAPM